MLHRPVDAVSPTVGTENNGWSCRAPVFSPCTRRASQPLPERTSPFEVAKSSTLTPPQGAQQKDGSTDKLNNDTDPTTIPTPTSLQHLRQLLHDELAPHDGTGHATLSPSEVERVSAIMAAYEPSRLLDETDQLPQDWSPYALYEPGKAYSRNLVDDGNGRFNLMILIWAPDQAR